MRLRNAGKQRHTRLHLWSRHLTVKRKIESIPDPLASLSAHLPRSESLTLNSLLGKEVGRQILGQDADIATQLGIQRQARSNWGFIALPSLGDSLPALLGLLGALPVVLELHSERGGRGFRFQLPSGNCREIEEKEAMENWYLFGVHQAAELIGQD